MSMLMTLHCYLSHILGIPKAGAAEEAAAWVPRLRPRLMMGAANRRAVHQVMNRFSIDVV
jgi:hypothetical protein